MLILPPLNSHPTVYLSAQPLEIENTELPPCFHKISSKSSRVRFSRSYKQNIIAGSGGGGIFFFGGGGVDVCDAGSCGGSSAEGYPEAELGSCLDLTPIPEAAALLQLPLWRWPLMGPAPGVPLVNTEKKSKLSVVFFFLPKTCSW